jgi:hypothetical protein
MTSSDEIDKKSSKDEEVLAKINSELQNMDRIYIMASEPLEGRSIEEMQELAEKTTDTETLANLYAAVCNEFFWIEDNEYDFPQGTPEYAEAIQITDQWGNLMDELEARLMQIAAEERLLLPEESVSWRLNRIERFMKKYGLVNVGGWWVKETLKNEELQGQLAFLIPNLGH